MRRSTLLEFHVSSKLLITLQAGTKLVCAVLSLPLPSKSLNPCGESLTNSLSRAVPDYFEHRTLQKILLVGYNGSGTSTIFKQVLFNSRLNL